MRPTRSPRQVDFRGARRMLVGSGLRRDHLRSGQQALRRTFDLEQAFLAAALPLVDSSGQVRHLVGQAFVGLVNLQADFKQAE